MNTTTLVPVVRRSPTQVARLVLSLFKLRIGVLIMVTALVGLAVTPGAAPTVIAASAMLKVPPTARGRVWKPRYCAPGVSTEGDIGYTFMPIHT